MRRWTGLLTGLLLLGSTSMVRAEEGRLTAPQVVADMTVVVLPGDTSPQCLLLDGQTVTVELRRLNERGGTVYPIDFEMGPFVVASSPFPSLTVAETPLGATVPIASGVYCYSFHHPQTWVDRPTSAGQAQFIQLRLTQAP
jgi:hypothetical protein